MKRDPRIDPHKGDLIRQKSGIRIRVTDIDGDHVSWAHGVYMSKENGGSLKLWRNVVADGSEVLEIA